MLVLDRQECQALCDLTIYCNAWTFDKGTNICGMKQREGWTVVEVGYSVVEITELAITIIVGYLSSNNVFVNILTIFSRRSILSWNLSTKTVH